MRFIGITGGVGSGKSEILKFIEKHYKCKIYLADQVAHVVKEKGQPCYYRLVEALGEDILEENGEINKNAMAAKIFANKELLKKVNEIIHPEVKQYILDRLQEAKEEGELELFFVEAALLIEGGYGELVDEMWYIYTERNVRIERLKQSRGYSLEKIEQIMGSQLSEDAFREACDFEINNSAGLEESFEQIKEKLEDFTWQA